MIIAIDGPAGAGKSSVARAVAERLGICMLDTGATYRACALATIRDGNNPSDDEATIRSLGKASIRIVDDGNGISRVELDGEDVTDLLHTPEIDSAVTPVCQVREVRDAMTALQRGFAAGHDVICEGRDMGTVVFPDAGLKVWLTASPEERARRRSAQFGQDVHLVLEDILRRDRSDSEREIAPMVAAADAVTVDTTGMSFDEVVDAICGLAGGIRG